MGQGQTHRGQQRDKPFRDALRAEIATAQDENDFKSLRRIARKLLETAADGDTAAIKEVADRLDGKVPQAVVGDDEGDPIRFSEATDEQRAKALAVFLARTGQGSKT